MSGKGSGRRPTQVDNATFESNWDRAFKCGVDKTVASLRAAIEADVLGTSSTGRASGSNPDSVGSTPTSPAILGERCTFMELIDWCNRWNIDANWPSGPVIKDFRIIDHLKSDEELEAYVKEVADLYVDDATGKQVSEHWWPGDDVK